MNVITGILKAATEDVKEVASMLRGEGQHLEKKADDFGQRVDETSDDIQKRIDEQRESSAQSDKNMQTSAGISHPNIDRASHEAKEFGSGALQAMQEGAQKAAITIGDIAGGVESSVDAVKDAAAKAGDRVQHRDTTNVAAEQGERTRDSVKDTFSSVRDAASDTANTVKDKVTDALDSARDTAQNLRDDMLDKDGAERSRDAFHGAYDKTRQQSKTTAEQTTEALKGSANRIQDDTNDAANRAGDAARETGDSIRDAARETGDRARDAADSVKDSVSDAIDNTKDAARDVTEKVKETVSDAAQATADAGTRVTHAVVGTAQDNMDSAREAMEKTADKAWAQEDGGRDTVMHTERQDPSVTIDEAKESFKDVLEKTRDTLHNTFIADEKTAEPAMAPENVPPVDLSTNTADMIKQGQISA